MPRVSIILPAYNAEPFIEQTVESIRNQTFADYELIAVNDGSTDRTGEILDRLVENFPQLRVIHQENRGLAASRNRAIAESSGELIALQDADDLWLPEKLTRCVAFLDEHPELSVVYTPMDPFNGETGERMEGHSKPCQSGWLAEKLFMSIFVHDPAAVFRRKVIDECGGFEESIPVCIGNEFWLRVSAKFEFGLIDKPLALRRWTETSLTRGNRLRGRKIKAAVHEKFYFELGGKDIIPAHKALPRLAKINYHVGKMLLQQRQFREALGYLIKAVKFKPTYLKVYPLILLALLGYPIR